ncbi:MULTISPECIES: sugar phosphate isomerase/epimerase family protein [Bacillus]|uniref:Xylose isomerase-like TIM barrel domain-containing protein n=2 Tax=Bacillus TaxID=1386 RepID=A0A0M5JAK8_9BACI|nr:MULTISPECIES: TIM barrel protein [Bacillus]ALC82989.1 hypothetical protein AM592_16445 [Bacillus gobiensis]MBP1082002.1 sugar phosphate isomerase/epimerase [Bacillus capparidis]MED1096637.1 TIM barrel protein [Bacillus capparidis]
MNHVIVPLNVFPKNQVIEKGQESFLPLIAQSGAYGAEIRRELFQEAQGLPLKNIKIELQRHSLYIVYSAPIELWKEGGKLNNSQLEMVIDEAYRLGAKILKLSLGHYQKSTSDIRLLKEVLRNSRITENNLKLLIENDQTHHGGNIDRLREFFETVYEHKVPIEMTFDTGNWDYVNECGDQAVRQLSKYVAYIHLKQVESIDGERVTIPISLEKWREIESYFPRKMLKAIEFPIQSLDQIKKYIEMFLEKTNESEESL